MSPAGLDLTGRVAVVSGAAAGIGAGIAGALHRHGAAVVLVDIDGDTLRATAAGLGGTGAPVLAVECDVTDRSAVARLEEEAAAFGEVDVLVNNVGDHRPWGPLLESTEDDWDTVIDLNFRHVVRLTRTFAPGMVARRRGSIVNVSSVEAFRGVPHCAVYAACKAAVVNLTAGLATELGHHGVRVNGIAPDLTETPQFPLSRMIKEPYRDQVGSWLPVGRWGQPDDHGDVVAFLVSDLARFVTGETIRTDGGTMGSVGWFRRADGTFTNVPRDFR